MNTKSSGFYLRIKDSKEMITINTDTIEKAIAFAVEVYPNTEYEIWGFGDNRSGYFITLKADEVKQND